MGDWFNGQIAQSVLRNIGQSTGSIMAAQGWLSNDQATLWTGAVIAVGSLVFSVVSARFKKVAIEEAGGKQAVKDAIETKTLR